MKKLLALADRFSKELAKTAVDSPHEGNVTPVIKHVVGRLQKQKPELFEGIEKVAEHVRVEGSIDATVRVYFILDITPAKYNGLSSDPIKVQRDEMIKRHVEYALDQSFPGYKFFVKVGYVPA